jgi:hypothetical protein
MKACRTLLDLKSMVSLLTVTQRKKTNKTLRFLAIDQLSLD